MMQNRYLFLLLLAFLLLEIMLIGFADRPLSEALRHVDEQHKSLIDVFRTYTDLGKSKWYLWPAFLGIILCATATRLRSFSHAARNRFQHIGEFLLFLFVCVAISGIVTDIIKAIAGRARPVELMQENIYGFHLLSFAARWNSMPSGHATTAFALAFVVAHRFPRLRIMAFLLGFILAISRIMVNAHYLSDVVAGAAVAFVTVGLVLRLERHNGIYHINKRIFPIDDGTAAR